MAKGYHLRGRRFPEIGRIRKGAPKGQNRPGKDLTYFRIDLDETDPHYEQSKSILEERYGQEPRWLDVILPFDNVDEVFQVGYEAYLASGMVVKAEYWPNDDGLNKVVFVSDNARFDAVVEEGEFVDVDKPVGTYKTKSGHERELFMKPRGRLRVMLPALKRLAFLTVLTGSHNDIGNIESQLSMVADFGQRLTQVPFLLRRKPEQVSAPIGDDGERSRVEKWLLQIEPHPVWVQQKLLENPSMMLALEAGDTVDAEYRQLALPEGAEEETEAAPQAEPAPEPEPEPEPETNGFGKDAASQYWYTAYNVAGLDEDTARAILKECGGDLVRAKEVVEEQHVPPEN